MSTALSDLSTDQIAAMPAADRQALEDQMAAQFAPEESTEPVADATPTQSDAPAAEATKPDATTTGTEQAAPEIQHITQFYTAEAPADASAQIAAAREAKSAAKKEDATALKQLHDGEINFAEYEAVKIKADGEIEAANETIATLNTALNNAKIAADMTTQARDAAWGAECDRALKQAATEGIDYAANEPLRQELDGLVRSFGVEANHRGLNDSNNLESSKYALTQALELMKMRYPELLKTKAESPAQELARRQADAALKAGQPRHNLTALNRMPNADRATVDNDDVSRFATIPGHQVGQKLAGMSRPEAEKLFASL